MANTVKDRLRLSEIIQHPEFLQLSPQQQAFTAQYIASGLVTGVYDAVTACRTAYKTSSARNALLLSYELLGNRKIRKVVDIHMGRTPLDSIMSDLERVIRKSLRKDAKRGGLSAATVEAIAMFERYSGQKIEQANGD